MQGAQEEEEEEEEGVNETLIRKHQLPLSAQSAFSYIPPRRTDPPELSYFHQESKIQQEKGLASVVLNRVTERPSGIARLFPCYVPGLIEPVPGYVIVPCTKLLDQDWVSPTMPGPGNVSIGAQTVMSPNKSNMPGTVSLYDCIFKRPVGYDAKLHRCDREHAKSRGLHINDEEKARPVPVLDSSVYGRRIDKPVEELIRDHVRINHVKAEFYRKNGITCLVEKSNQSIDPI